ncbi:hypothetical protein D8B22_05540 [Verminephrobacter aporrectodeae subsp. tuberculatae]|nr:hypothetical protein [Verminephrobacter aporrectodeae subsp. tuberculatae]MCW8168590.1 hypothetical protein [Verminephrobacter aporrectodeae subsp. tuberculatae]
MGQDQRKDIRSLPTGKVLPCETQHIAIFIQDKRPGVAKRVPSLFHALYSTGNDFFAIDHFLVDITIIVFSPYFRGVYQILGERPGLIIKKSRQFHVIRRQIEIRIFAPELIMRKVQFNRHFYLLPWQY